MARKPKFETAWDLVEAVKQAIKDTPKLYNQNRWHCPIDDNGKSCGMAGCIAGWIVALHDGPKTLAVLNDMRDYNIAEDGVGIHAYVYNSPVAQRAAQILGLPMDTLVETFKLNKEAEEGLGPQEGTVRHARDGVKRIVALQKAHKNDLKYTLLS